MENFSRKMRIFQKNNPFQEKSSHFKLQNFALKDMLIETLKLTHHVTKQSLTYPFYLFLAKLLSRGKTYISFWLKFLSLGKSYIFSWLNFSLGKTYIFSWLKNVLSWQNLYLIFYWTSNFWQNVYLFLTKLFFWQNLYLSLVNHFSFGKTYIYLWLIFFLLAKPISILG